MAAHYSWELLFSTSWPTYILPKIFWFYNLSFLTFHPSHLHWLFTYITCIPALDIHTLKKMYHPVHFSIEQFSFFQQLAPIFTCTNNSLNSRPLHWFSFRTVSVYMPNVQEKWLRVILPKMSVPGLVILILSDVANIGCAKDLLGDLGQLAQPLWAVF